MPDRHHGGIDLDLNDEFTKSSAIRQALLFGANAGDTSSTVSLLFDMDARNVFDKIPSGHNAADELHYRIVLI
jgi:hypothetical protein